MVAQSGKGLAGSDIAHSQPGFHRNVTQARKSQGGEFIFQTILFQSAARLQGEPTAFPLEGFQKAVWLGKRQREAPPPSC